MSREAGVPRPAAARLVAVLRPRGADSTSPPTCRRRRSSRRRPRRSGSSSTSRQIFVFFVTVYVGAGLIANDRRANALQIYLSKPLTRAEYVFGKLAILMTFLLLVTWVPAIVLLIVQIVVRRQLHVLQEQPVPVPGDHACSRSSRSSLVATTMLALSSLVEEQPLRRHPLCRRHLLQRRRSTACSTR